MGSSRVLRTRRCLRPQRGCSSLFAAVVLVVGLVVAIPASAPATSSMFTTIDGPGAFFTQATGINATGQIVGAFVAPTGFHGFLDTGGVFTLIDVPGADSTLAFRMNEYDEYAVEQAVRLKEQLGDAPEITVLSIGPDRVVEALKKALAMGCDRAVQVRDPAPHTKDPWQIAAIGFFAVAKWRTRKTSASTRC